MPDVIVRRREDERVVLGVGVNGGKTEVLHVVGTAGFVEEDVPVGPPHGAAVEVIDHGVAVAFRVGPALVVRCIKPLLAPFREQELLVGVGLFDELEVLVLGVAAGPGFVPVKAGAPGILRGVGIVENGICAVGNEVAIVVPHDDFLVTVSGGFHCGAEVVFQEIAFLLGGVNARFPALRCHGFVLDGHPPYWEPFRFVGLDEFHKVVGPRLVVFRQQRAAAQHVLVGFHKGGRAPRTRVKHQVLSNHCGGTLDHWNALGPIGFDIKCGQRRVSFFDVGVAPEPEVAAVDACPYNVVVDSSLTEVGVHELGLHGRAQLGEHLSGSVCDGPADSHVRLEGVFGVDKYSNFCFQRLLRWGKNQCFTFCQSKRSVFSGDSQPCGRTNGFRCGCYRFCWGRWCVASNQEYNREEGGYSKHGRKVALRPQFCKGLEARFAS